MTRSNAREVAVHMIYELGFGSRSAEELLEHVGSCRRDV